MTSISQAIISQSSNSDKFGAVPAKDEGRSSNRKDLIETFLTIKEPDRSLEASITDSNEISAILTNAKIVVDSEDENKIQVSTLQILLRVDLTGDQTQKVFDRILTNLGRTAPPVPGFRMQKGAAYAHIKKYQALSLFEAWAISHRFICNSYFLAQLRLVK
ncbi:hypothetical protein JHK87_030706 [Glycine soja]|nr:hypothetical protein JHK87_030706 [Glycine soja]